MSRNQYLPFPVCGHMSPWLSRENGMPRYNNGVQCSIYQHVSTNWFGDTLSCQHVGQLCHRILQLCCASGNLWQFFYLHKSKMNSGRHFDNFSFEPLVLECRIIPLLYSFKVRRIHFWCYLLKSWSCSRSNMKYLSIIIDTFETNLLPINTISHHCKWLTNIWTVFTKNI